MAEGGEASSQGLGAEAALNMAQMFQAMVRQFATAITDLWRETPREEERGCLFKCFERLHIPPFDGKRDPMEWENRLTDIEEICNLQAVRKNRRCNTVLINYQVKPDIGGPPIRYC
jgi:hypothetical protein